MMEFGWMSEGQSEAEMEEVKAEDRALTAFREARAEFGCFRFYWVVWSGREWIFKHEEKK